MNRKAVYVTIYIFISALFLKLLYAQAAGSFFELDLAWFVPGVLREARGLGILEGFGYLLRLFPQYFASPTLKVYTIFSAWLFAPLAKNFIFVSIVFHFGCSGLLYLLSKNLGFNARISFFSSIMYLTLFAHFHAYMWPMAFHHLVAVFFILLGLNLYLRTDRLISSRKRWGLSYACSLAVSGLAALCSFSVLILPAIVMSHILFCSRGHDDRIRKYNIWFPLFIIYPLRHFMTFLAGEVRIVSVFNKFMPFIGNADFATIPLKALFMLVLVLIALLIFRQFLIAYKKDYIRRIFKWAAIMGIAAVIFILIILGGVKRLFIPYNMAVPFEGILMSFLDPIKDALSMDSAHAYYFIPLQISVFGFLLSFFIVTAFIKNYISKQRNIILLFVFYAGDMVYLYLRNPVASRYMIYLSPVFCVIFCAVFDSLAVFLSRYLKSRAPLKEAIAILVFLGLCIPNLLAIKLALVRGRAVNNFCTYDYASTADAIKSDIEKKGTANELPEKIIFVDNVVPMVFTPVGNFSSSDPYNDNTKLVFKQVFGDPALDVQINTPFQKNTRGLAYSLSADGYCVDNASGEDVKKFSIFFKKGIRQLGLGRYEAAEPYFRKAMEANWFFNYALSGMELRDVKWLTGGADVRSWVNKIGGSYTIKWYNEDEIKRNKYVLSIIEKDIDGYIQCLFYIAFIKHISGNPEEAGFLFSKIGFLENDYGRLFALLSNAPPVRSDQRIMSFLRGFDGSSLYITHDTYTDRFEFEQFMIRMVKT
jgi:hypothetical protein